MKSTLVFGASLKSNRYSNIAMHRLTEKGIQTYGFGLKEGIVSGVDIKTDLKEFTNIHTVTLYMNPKRQEEYYDAIIHLKPKRVVFNPGTENPDFYHILQKNGIDVEVACTLVLLATDQY